MLYIVYMYMYVYIVCSIIRVHTPCTWVYIYHNMFTNMHVIYINMSKLAEPVWLQINRCVCRWLRLKLFGICAFNPLLKHVPLYASVHVAFGITDSRSYTLSACG